VVVVLKRWPWIFLVILFLLSSGGAIFFTVVALKNTPETVEMEIVEREHD